MGEFADMFLEQCFDDWDEEGFQGVGIRKELRCNHCNKRGLAWRQVKRKWVLFEKNGNVHSCHGYEPPIDILKEIAKETLETTRKDAQWRLLDKAKKKGGIKRIINIISDEELIDLYACFVRDEQSEHDNPEVGMSFGYKNEIQLLKDEILRRMLKK
jgi:hypothetical protein